MPLRKNLVEDLMSAIEGIVQRPQFPPPPSPPRTPRERVTDWLRGVGIVIGGGCFVLGWLAHAFVVDWESHPYCDSDRIVAAWERTLCEENWYVAHSYMANSERTVGPHGEALTPVSPIPPDQLPKIRELIRRHGRDVVIDLLREQGYDAQGL